MTANTENNPTTDVVVIGGGYAGVMAANRLTQRDDITVTLVNPRPRFVERLRLHQHVAGEPAPVVDYQEILSERIRLVVDTATDIDATGRTVALEGGDTLAYDYLVYAPGSGSFDLSSVPGADEFVYPVANLEAATRLREVIDAAPASSPITVVGSGATGIEVASELAEQSRAVTLVCGKVLCPYLHPKVRRKFAKRLAKMGVNVIAGPDATVTAVSRHAVQLRDGRELLSEVTIWTAGFSVPDLARRSGLTTDDTGRLLTDETLISVDSDRILAAGDSASPSGVPFRASCATARPLGAYAADTILARLEDKEPKEVNIGTGFQCIALGRNAAIVQLASMQDVANRFSIRGPLGQKIKSSSYGLLTEELGKEARKPGSFNWRLKDNKRRQKLSEMRDAAAPGSRQVA
ncbi:FAD-dependent oxidoreductase [Actinopolymorpha sp. B17G11]|uniref:NAD(P)/FAD-dependent oxidoreductase n=1 Tax=Actinopolymorpha sp. B17G11 TaxID=3160861 RepID=UPI0032E4A8CA